jgi:non-specific serine/threonine protein kinase/serine/threonine-protein kinase
MTADKWATVRELVEGALALPPSEREAFLRSAAPGDAVAAEAAQLLAFEADASAIFFRVGSDKMIDARFDETSLEGAFAGNYRIIRELGRGGMGTVYLAERADGEYTQRVALKVLQEGAVSPALTVRFRQERQILAALTHPGIARLLDGGLLADGRPYLILEYIDGKPIDVWCVEHSLDLEARLRLFLQVAEAVQSAHQQLVLHLDLKPANILVNERGEPRLLDFGIARFLGEGGDAKRSGEDTLRLLTPRYASPEQAAGTQLGVASDVFSLATLLYRLLTGTLPYPLDDVSPLEAARIICEMAARPPSLAAPSELRSLLRGDLDNILLRGLRKEPERRYPTVAAFADDIERYLEAKPVSAHADSFAYRAGKFWQRNRAAVIAAGFALAVLLFSIAAVTRSAILARRALRTAEEQRAVAQRRLNDVRGIAHSYIFDLDPKLEQNPANVPVRVFVLQNGLKYLEAMSRENVEEDEDLAHEIGMGYIRVGQVQADPAMPSLNDLPGAWTSMNKGLVIQQELLRRHPDDLKQLSMVARQLAQMEYLAMVDGDLTRSYSFAMQSWQTIQPLLRAGPGAPRFVHLDGVPWDIACLYEGNGELWNFADPAASLPWLDRVHEIGMRYAAHKPENAHSNELIALLQRETLSRAQAYTLLDRKQEARQQYEAAIRYSEAAQVTAEDRQALTVARISFAEWLLREGDLASLRGFAKSVVVEDDHGRTEDRNLQETIADQLLLLARIHFAFGEHVLGVEAMHRGISIFERLYKQDPHEATNGSVMAHDFYQLGQQSALSTVERRRFYLRSIEITKLYFSAHPEALSAAVLIGEDNLGLAKLAPDLKSRRSFAANAVDQLRKVVSMHPTHAEAQQGLAAAQALL